MNGVILYIAGAYAVAMAAGVIWLFALRSAERKTDLNWDELEWLEDLRHRLDARGDGQAAFCEVGSEASA